MYRGACKAGLGKGEGLFIRETHTSLPQCSIFYFLFMDEVPEAQAVTIGT